MSVTIITVSASPSSRAFDVVSMGWNFLSPAVNRSATRFVMVVIAAVILVSCRAIGKE
jgi:hypothetical protein